LLSYHSAQHDSALLPFAMRSRGFGGTMVPK
jgi:hypothetical protein